MMKYTFAAALFAAAIYATEIVDPVDEEEPEVVVVDLEDVPEPEEKEQAEPAKTESSPEPHAQPEHVPESFVYRDDVDVFNQHSTGPDPEDCPIEWFKQFEKLDTDDYQSLPAFCKQAIVWERVNRDYSVERFFTGHEFQGFFEQDMNHSFDIVSDTMPVGRIKRTHPRGVVTLLEFIPTYDTPYTGIFRGCKHAIHRISEFSLTTPETPKTAPGHGVKFFRDGMASANWFAMFAFDGQPSFNFFKNRWTNILKEMDNDCARETIGKHLAEVSDHTGAMSVMELAEFDQYGRKEPHPHWPFNIEVEPYDVYGWTDAYQNDFQDQLAVVPVNTVMFKIFGYDCPIEHGCPERHIGWLVTRSKTTPSLWGDRELFFQHHRYEDDIKMRPHYFEWLQFWDAGRFTETPLRDPAPTQKCPFMFLFEEAGLM